MYKRSFGHDQRNGDPPHGGRIKNSDQLHEVSSLKRRVVGEETAKTQGTSGGWMTATGDESLRSQGMHGN